MRGTAWGTGSQNWFRKSHRQSRGASADQPVPVLGKLINLWHPALHVTESDDHPVVGGVSIPANALTTPARSPFRIWDNAISLS